MKHWRSEECHVAVQLNEEKTDTLYFADDQVIIPQNGLEIEKLTFKKFMCVDNLCSLHFSTDWIGLWH